MSCGDSRLRVLPGLQDHPHPGPKFVGAFQQRPQRSPAIIREEVATRGADDLLQWASYHLGGSLVRVEKQLVLGHGEGALVHLFYQHAISIPRAFECMDLAI